MAFTVPLPFSGSDILVGQWPDGLFWGLNGFESTDPDHVGRSADAYDFTLPQLTAVLGLGHGRVVASVDVVDDGTGATTDPYGNFVTVQYDDGYYATYAHLKKGTALAIGSEVTLGKPVGEVGLTGNTTGAHLHIQFGLSLYTPTTSATKKNQVAYSGDDINIVTFGNPGPLVSATGKGYSEDEYTYSSAANLGVQLNASPIVLSSNSFKEVDSVGTGFATSAWNSDDYWSFLAPSDGSLNITLSGQTNALSLSVLAANGYELTDAQAHSTTAETVSVDAKAGYTYYIHVAPYYPIINAPSDSEEDITSNYTLGGTFTVAAPVTSGADFTVKSLGSASEGNPLTFRISINNPRYDITSDYRIYYQTEDDTAAAGENYTYTVGHVDFTSANVNGYVDITVPTISAGIASSKDVRFEILDYQHDTLPNNVATGVIDSTTLTEPKSTLPVSTGGTATISHSFLWSYDSDNVTGTYGNPADITYTVTTPTRGTVLLKRKTTTTFTQADIDNGLVQYRQNGDAATKDSFTFTVSDKAGNQITEPYDIAIVDTTAPVTIGDEGVSASVGGSTILWTDSLCTVALGNDPGDMHYKVLDAPSHGMLFLDGAPTTSFTQAEIDDHRVAYAENGDKVTSDSFVYTVADKVGDQTPAETFTIDLSAGAPPATTAAASTTTFQDISGAPLVGYAQSTGSSGGATATGAPHLPIPSASATAMSDLQPPTTNAQNAIGALHLNGA